MLEETGPVGPAPIPAIPPTDVADDFPVPEPSGLGGGFPAQEDGPAQDSPRATSAPDAAAQAEPSADSAADAEKAEEHADHDYMSPDPQMPASDGAGSCNLHAGYAAIAAPTANSHWSIAAAGLVANNLNAPVTIAPQIRVRDVLTGSLVDRVAVRDDPAYVENEEWSQARQAAARTLPENRILVIVAPRGYGSTTFSLRLLACHTSDDVELIRLEADWGSPKVGKLPLERNRAYQLDLQDPDHDRFDSAFFNGLGKHAADLEALGSFLVLNVASELWQAHCGQLPPGVVMRRLDDPPDAGKLVERHLAKRELGFLVVYVRSEEAVRHIKGCDAVQAIRAVDVVVREWAEHQKSSSSEAMASDGEAADAASADRLGSPRLQLDSALQRAIEEALGDWEDDLNALFEEPPRNLGDGRSLLPEDRCLLMSLALRQTGTAAEIESAALALEQTLAKNGRGTNGRAADAWSTLSRRGLRPRLKAFEAAIDRHDRVTFNRPGYAEAVLAYVWDNYSPLQDDLITWMVGRTTANSQQEDPAAETLTALILRLQDAGRLTSLRDSALARDRRDVIVRVMAAAAADEHMGRRARSLLYDWAESQRPDIQHIVLAVCQQLIVSKESMALVRIRRVANNAADVDVRKQVLAVFRDTAANKELTARFADAVASWQQAEPASQAVKLGILALLAVESGGKPWIPSHATKIDVTGGLRVLLSDPRSSVEAVAAITSWVRSCACDPGLCATSRMLVANAIRSRHAFNTGISLMGELRGVTTPDGSNVGEDLFAEIAEPELLSFSR